MSAENAAGVHHQHGRAVNWRIGRHGVDEGDVVNFLSQMGEQIADPFAAFAVLPEFPARLHNPPLIAMPAATEGLHFDGFAIHAVHAGFVIEGIDLAGATVHVEKDDMLCAWRDMRCLCGKRIAKSHRCFIGDGGVLKTI
jgi:hypothetical protein